MPTVFISYAWESDEHKAWVRRLGVDLQASGITVWLDQLELRLGDDVTQFMDRGVAEADYVLLVCTDKFGQKANGRRGGVGYEQSIVTAELLNAQPVRGRFVCVLRQGAPSVALPRYMQSRLWLDCRDDAIYPTALKQLADHILNRSDASISAPAATTDTSIEAPSTAAASYGDPAQWVLVAGTGAERGFSAELTTLSRDLGARLAAARCGIVTGGWPGVDEWVARSFADAVSHLRAPLEDLLVQIIVEREEPSFPAGQLVFVKKGNAEYEEPVQRASVVILLGGLGGTKEIGRRALRQGKPVLPIADTGGDAKAVYLEMLRAWPSFQWMGLTDREFQRLARPAPGAIEAAVELALRARSKSPPS